MRRECLELDKFAKDESFIQFHPLEFKESPYYSLYRRSIGGRGNEARFSPPMLLRFHVIFDDNRRLAEWTKKLHETIHGQSAAQLHPHSLRRASLDNPIRLRQMMAVDVAGRVIDQPNSTIRHSLVQPLVRCWSHHPAPVNSES